MQFFIDIFVVPFSVAVSGDLSLNLVPLLCDSRQYLRIPLSTQIASISVSKYISFQILKLKCPIHWIYPIILAYLRIWECVMCMPIHVLILFNFSHFYRT